jgi:hypothetical protein
MLFIKMNYMFENKAVRKILINKEAVWAFCDDNSVEYTCHLLLLEYWNGGEEGQGRGMHTEFLVGKQGGKRTTNAGFSIGDAEPICATAILVIVDIF